MENIIELILGQNDRNILLWAARLTDGDRKEALEQLNRIDVESDLMEIPVSGGDDLEYADRRNLLNCYCTFAKITCLRTFGDLKENSDSTGKSPLHIYMEYPALGAESLVEYFKLFPPDYLDQVIDYWIHEREVQAGFELVWQLYKHGWLAFKEEVFVRSLFFISPLHNNTLQKSEFLATNPEIIENVLLQFYKYEIPILDMSKWQNATGENYTRCFAFWEEVFCYLLDKQLIKDRRIVPNLLETISSNWKKAYLDCYVRLIKMLDPSAEELLTNQQLLFASVHTAGSMVTNYFVQSVASIYQDDRFDCDAFLQSLTTVCTKDKCDKSILLSLDMASWMFENKPGLIVHVPLVANALTQMNDKIQVRAAGLLMKYIPSDNLLSVIKPFKSHLKKKVRGLLEMGEQASKENGIVSPIEPARLSAPASWEDFLLHTGKMISTLSPADIDLFYESVIQLQDQFPRDYKSQLKPYTRELFKLTQENDLLLHLAEFFYNWFREEPGYIYYPSLNAYQVSSYIRSKNQWVLSRLLKKSKLPLLSTPTHFPFLIHPEVLVQRLVDFENSDEEVEWEDLVVGCNRLIKAEITGEVKDQAGNLKGKYAKEIRHWLEGTQIPRTLDSVLYNVPGSFEEFNYRISLIPYNADSLLLQFLPEAVSGNEERAQEYSLSSLKFLTENDVPLHQDGWGYIAFCLLFEKKHFREWASSYIRMTFQRNFINREYLAQCISSRMLKHAIPVIRLIEYFEKSDSLAIKEFQLEIVIQYIKGVEKENIPVNFSKIVTCYTELIAILGKYPDPLIEEELNRLKK